MISFIKKICFAIVLGLVLGFVVLGIQPACKYLPECDPGDTGLENNAYPLVVDICDSGYFFWNDGKYSKISFCFNGVPCTLKDLQKQLDRVSSVLDDVSVIVVADKKISLARYFNLRFQNQFG